MDDEDSEAAEPLYVHTSPQRRPTLSQAKASLLRLIAIAVLERVAFYSIELNALRSFSQSYTELSNVISTTLSTMFVGLPYVLAPFFGIVADCKLGYYATLTIAFAFYTIATSATCAVGRLLESNSTYDQTRLDALRGVYLASLVAFALGAAAVRATLVPYMLDQIEDEYRHRRRLLEKFCTFVYVAFNVAATIGALASYVELRHAVRPRLFWTYLLAPVAAFLALLLLVIWRKKYGKHRQRADRCPNACTILGMGFGCIRRRRRHGNERSNVKIAILIPVLVAVVFYRAVYSRLASFHEMFSHSDAYDNAKYANVTNGTTLTCPSLRCEPTLGYYASFPPGLLVLFDTISVLLSVPVVWYVLRPVYERCVGKELDMLTRIHWGIFLVGVVVLGGVGVEVARRVGPGAIRFAYTCAMAGRRHCVEVVPYKTKLSPLATLVPLYALTGLTEVLAVIATMEFVLSRAPRELRCTAYGVYNFAIGVGIYVGAAYREIARKEGFFFRSWSNCTTAATATVVVPSYERSEMRAWIYFLGLVGLAFVNWAAFFCAKKRCRFVRLET
ncbi:solute carrier family 15 member 4-like [Oscarella lobularis]|uniref:solute carrier family 15 member 4-like n=1 Tax=Oscarella lobularis TaxID=121494 RepID=UPI003313C0BB